VYITGRIYSVLRKSPIAVFWALVTRAGQFKSIREIFILCGEADRMLVYFIKKSSKFCLPIWEGQVQAGEMKSSSLKFVCITFFGVEEKESLLEQS
jgi:hypothetical protein